MKPLVSVIVPVYNCEKWLNSCLESLADQSWADCEFIIIDDGSTDSSRKIAQAFAERDSRFVLISQPNGGVAKARNTGLAAAKGEYITFADSDDRVSKDYVQSLVSTAVKTKAEVVVCDYNLVYITHTAPHEPGLAPGQYINPGDYWLRCVALSPEVWCKLYRRSVIEASKAKFSMNIGEDLLFNTMIAPFITKVVAIPDRCYYYTQRRSSLMRAKKSDNGITMIDTFIDRIADNEVYIKLGADFYSLFCATAITATIHSPEAVGQGISYYKKPISRLKGWDGYGSFKKAVLKDRLLDKLTDTGAMGKTFAKLLKLTISMGGLGIFMLPMINKLVVKKRSEKAEELFQ